MVAVEAQFAAFNRPREVWELREYDREVAASNATLSEEAFVQAWAEGHSLILEDAIREALDLGSKAKFLKISGY